VVMRDWFPTFRTHQYKNKQIEIHDSWGAFSCKCRNDAL